jgi:hypothetical protein
VAAMFAENMAVLLEPDPGYRAADERWCKQLYDKRSGVLHGTNIECSVRDLREAHAAGVAVLKAIVERREGVRRLQGEDDNPEELLKEFKGGKYDVGQPMFVRETPLNVLWRDPEKQS